MTIEAGKRYFRKRGGCARVRLVLAVDGDRVEYEVLHGPAAKRQARNRCSLRRFADWADGEFEGEDPGRLDGARLHGTFVVQNVAGRPLFRCSRRRGRFYLRKGYAVSVDEATLRLTDATTETVLTRLYGERLSPFFLEVKNDHCVVCGKDHNLTRHHVVPRRHLRRLPLEVRSQLSNVLFVCLDCHRAYEARQLTSTSTDPHVWKDHFLQAMQPRFLPQGWDIVLTLRGVSGS
jgi:hypothetical protein